MPPGHVDEDAWAMDAGHITKGKIRKRHWDARPNNVDLRIFRIADRILNQSYTRVMWTTIREEEA